jgi:hypothetical protein
MKYAAAAMILAGAVANSPAPAQTRYMLCFGGGRAGLYYSGVFPVPAATRDEDKAKAFGAFVKGKYGTTIMAECHTDLTLASAASDKKMREQNDQGSRFPSRIIETGWAGN